MGKTVFIDSKINHSGELFGLANDAERCMELFFDKTETLLICTSISLLS